MFTNNDQAGELQRLGNFTAQGNDYNATMCLFTAVTLSYALAAITCAFIITKKYTPVVLGHTINAAKFATENAIVPAANLLQVQHVKPPQLQIMLLLIL